MLATSVLIALSMSHNYTASVSPLTNTAQGTRYGIGKPAVSVPPEQHKIASILSKASIITYQCSVTAIKATFLLQYRRIFPLPGFQRLCDIVFWFNLLFGLSLILSVAIRCSNPANAWTSGYRGPGCIKMVPWWYTNATINLVTDVIILVMPIPMLRRLPLPRKPKLILFGVFGLGILYEPLFPLALTHDTNTA